MCAMEFRNVRDHPHGQPGNPGRPEGDPPGPAEAEVDAEAGAARADQGGPGRGGPESAAGAAAGDDAARLAQPAERTRNADRSEPGRLAHPPNRPVPES